VTARCLSESWGRNFDDATAPTARDLPLRVAGSASPSRAQHTYRHWSGNLKRYCQQASLSVSLSQASVFVVIPALNYTDELGLYLGSS
jgi:hypothetical protein